MTFILSNGGFEMKIEKERGGVKSPNNMNVFAHTLHYEQDVWFGFFYFMAYQLSQII